jgi:hypothetical protein
VCCADGWYCAWIRDPIGSLYYVGCCIHDPIYGTYCQ